MIIMEGRASIMPSPPGERRGAFSSLLTRLLEIANISHVLTVTLPLEAVGSAKLWART